MNLPLIYRPEAEDEIAEAHAWYENEEAGVGDEFVEAVRKAAAIIASNPRLYSKINREYYAAPMGRFPYVIYYRYRKDEVVIISVRHGRRGTRGLGKRA